MGKTDHVVISIGMKNNNAPHQHLWCTRCGETKNLGLPLELSLVIIRMNTFAKLHNHCAESSLCKKGFLKLGDLYVWNTLDISYIAEIAFKAATSDLGLTEEYVRPEYNQSLARQAIMDIIQKDITKTNCEWFSLNYGNLLGYPNQSLKDHLTNYASFRIDIFLKIADALLERK